MEDDNTIFTLQCTQGEDDELTASFTFKEGTSTADALLAMRAAIVGTYDAASQLAGAVGLSFDELMKED